MHSLLHYHNSGSHSVCSKFVRHQLPTKCTSNVIPRDLSNLRFSSWRISSILGYALLCALPTFYFFRSHYSLVKNLVPETGSLTSLNYFPTLNAKAQKLSYSKCVMMFRISKIILVLIDSGCYLYTVILLLDWCCHPLDNQGVNILYNVT